MTLAVASGDLLSAASLALTAITVLYSLWYGEITNAKAVSKRRKRADREPDLRQVSSVLQLRAIPIACSAILIGILLAPPAVGVLRSAAVGVYQSPLHTFERYDPVQALYVVVWLGLCGLAGLGVADVRALRNWRKDLSGPDT